MRQAKLIIDCPAGGIVPGRRDSTMHATELAALVAKVKAGGYSPSTQESHELLELDHARDMAKIAAYELEQRAGVPITRANHGQFCTEPPLTDAEGQEWRKVGAAIRAEMGTARTGLNVTGRWPLTAYVTKATERERFAYSLVSYTSTWADMAIFADACRRLHRAEIAAVAAYGARD